VNEGHPSGYTPDYDAYGYDPYSQGSYQTVGTAFPAQGQQAHAPYGQYDQGYGYAPADYGHAYGDGYGTPAGQSAAQPGYDYDYDPYAYAAAPVQQPPAQQPGEQATGTAYTAYSAYYDTGTYDSSLWSGTVPQQATGYPQQQDWDSGGYPAYGYGYGYDAAGDTGVYEQIPDLVPQPAPGTQPAPGPDPDLGPDLGLDLDPDPATAPADDEPVRHDYAGDGPGGDGRPAARIRRRETPKRSALLTIAVPSVAVMGVAAVGAAAVGGVGMAQDSPKTQADGQDAPAATAPTTQLDRQLTGASRDAGDFATRASRTQERIDLKDRQAAAARAKAAEAERKEALRPKFVLPVTERGLSAYFGQAGEHWMMLHTGIDFPVQVGTPVMAATDGTVRTQWNPSYGNMAIVTAADGTETWYCHLSRTRIRSGKVKAGTVIAYSGNTGNTTGPHLHFEVRPDGGQPVDPLPWLLAHGLDPR
jgi:murein DD-endopeptidase MepM/ murein hydrolase activator NlpD